MGFRVIPLIVLVIAACSEQDPAFTEDTSIHRQQSNDATALPPETDLPVAPAGTGTDSGGDADGVDGSMGSDGASADGGGGLDASGSDGDSDGSDLGDADSQGGDADTSDATGGDADTSDATGGMDMTDGTDMADSPGGEDAHGGGDDDTPNWREYTEETVQGGPGKVDVLWVVDSSGSMGEEQAYLGDNFEDFINALSGTGANFQTAVTSTDACHDTVPQDLAERRCPLDYGGSTATRHRGSFIGTTGRKVLKATDADLIDRFTTYTAVGTNGSGYEHGLKSAQLAVEKSISGANEPLVRADAFLAVIVVSDEEDDGIGLGMVDAYTGRNFVAEGITTFRYTHNDLIDYLKVVKGQGKFSVSTITGTRKQDGNLCSAAHSQPAEEGTQYIAAATATGGIVQSICETNWSNSLAAIGLDLTAQLTQIVLMHEADPTRIKVYVNGVQTSQWTYNSANNAVKFNTGHIPAEGAIIKVKYFGMP